MTWKDLVRAACEDTPGVSQKTMDTAGHALFEALAASMARGETVQVPGFGSFSGRFRAAHTGRNPATGAALEIPARLLPAFKPAATLKKYLQSGPLPGGS